MNISVILCTYNRCQSLEKALTSIAASILAASVDWEVVVVDNNSTDATRQVVEEISRQHPHRFFYAFEPRQGKSHALNTGIRSARGDILAFTDDDIIASPTWLQNLTEAFRDEKCMGCGGRVLADRDFEPPGWFPRDAESAWPPLALFNPGDKAGELTESPFGNNMAFRREAFDKYGTFRTDLGPCGGIDMKSEDAEFGCRLLARGELLRYEPSAVVYHAIPEERLKKKYFSKWWFNKSRSDVRRQDMREVSWRVLGILRSFRRLIRWTLMSLVATDAASRFTCQLRAWANLGEIVESYYQCRNGLARGRSDWPSSCPVKPPRAQNRAPRDT